MRLCCSKTDHNGAKVLALMLALDISAELAFHEESPADHRGLSLEETDSASDPLYEVNSILRYIARSYRDKGYAGILPKEEAQIDQWLAYTATNLDPLVSKIQSFYNQGVDPQGRLIPHLKSLSLKMDFLEQKLAQANFIVGYGATLADLSIASSFLTPLGSVFNAYYAWKYPNLAGYLERMS